MRRSSQILPNGKTCVEGTVQCDGKRHRLCTYKGKVHFTNHRVSDLTLIAALDSHCTCADILHALRTPEIRHQLVSLLPPRLFSCVAVYLFHRESSHAPDPPSWHEQCEKLLQDAIDRRFIPLLQGLDDLGLHLSILPSHDRRQADHAITLCAAEIPLGYFAANAWHLSPRQVAKMARTTTAYGKPHPSWGDDTCRVCPHLASDALSDTFDSIEEIPGPSSRHHTAVQHAQSPSHHQTIRHLLEDTFGPESLCAVPGR